jgi:hypothetical protein
MFFNIYFFNLYFIHPALESVFMHIQRHAIPSRAMITNRITHDFGGEGEGSAPLLQWKYHDPGYRRRE